MVRLGSRRHSSTLRSTTMAPGSRALLASLLSGPDVDDEPALGHETFEFMGSNHA